MADPIKKFDVWFVETNTVYKEVPFHVVTDWVQQARLGSDDMLKPSGTADWSNVGNLPLFQPYLPQMESQIAGTASEALEPIELDFNWKRTPDDDDDDVDMIPLIDISLVLLIFFMMTATVATISRIAVPNMENATKIDTNPGVLRIDIDVANGSPIYGLGIGTSAPAGLDADLSDETGLMLRLDSALAQISDPPEIRVAAHGDLPYMIVERIMRLLDERRDKGMIREYNIEVNELQSR